MAIIGNLLVKVGADVGALQTGFSKGGGHLKAFEKRVDAFAATVQSKMGMLFGLLAGAGFGLFAANTLQAADDLDEAAGKIGISTEKLAGLQLAARLNGSDVEGLNGAMLKLGDNLATAAMSGGPVEKALNEIGLSSRELIALSPDEKLAKIADGLQQIGSQDDKIRILKDIFGKAGADLALMLGSGSEGLKAMQAEAERLGIALKGADAAKLGEANDTVTKLKLSFQGLMNSALIAIQPHLQKILDGFINLTTWLRQINPETVKHFAQWAIGIGIFLKTIEMIQGLVTVYKSLAAAIQLSTKAQVVALALSGPKGWAILAAGAAVAAGAVYGLTYLFDSMGESAESAANKGSDALKQQGSEVQSLIAAYRQFVDESKKAGEGNQKKVGNFGKPTEDVAIDDAVQRQNEVEEKYHATVRALDEAHQAGQLSMEQYAAAMAQANKAFVEGIVATDKEIAAAKTLKGLKEQEDQAKKTADAIKQIAEATMTPQQKYQQQMAELNQIKGGLSAQQYDAAKKKYEDEFKGKIKSDITLEVNTLFEANSRELFQQIAKDNTQARQEEIANRQFAELQKQTRLQEELVALNNGQGVLDI